MTRLMACASLALVLHAPVALAEDAGGRATAIRLFEDGEKAMSEGNYGAACPKFAESQRLDPQLGTLLHLADCFEKWGKTASAWASFKEAADLAAMRNESGEREPR